MSTSLKLSGSYKFVSTVFSKGKKEYVVLSISTRNLLNITVTLTIVAEAADMSINRSKVVR